jgi:hypothetical protein
MIRNKDDGYWYWLDMAKLYDMLVYTPSYCIISKQYSILYIYIYLYDKIWWRIYQRIYGVMAMAFSWCSSTQKKQVFNGGRWSWAICRWSSVLLTVGAAGWVQPRTFSAFTQMVVLGDHIESTASIRRSNVTTDLGILYDWNHRNPEGFETGISEM